MKKVFLEAVSDDSLENVFDDLISLHLDKKLKQQSQVSVVKIMSMKSVRLH